LLEYRWEVAVILTNALSKHLEKTGSVFVSAESVFFKRDGEKMGKPTKSKSIRLRALSTRVLGVVLTLAMSLSSLSMVFADEPEEQPAVSVEVTEPTNPAESVYQPDQGIDNETDGFIGNSDAVQEPTGNENTIALPDDSIEPLASTFPYYVAYDPVPNSTKVTISLPNLDELIHLNTANSVTVEASMIYQGRVIRAPKMTQSLTALQAAGTNSFVMDFADYGRYSVVAKFYAGNNLAVTGDTVTVGITAAAYNIAPVSATMPLTFFSLALFGSNSIRYSSSGEIVPTILLLERPNSFDWNNLPEGVYGLPYLSKTDLAFQPASFTDASNRFRSFTPVMAEYVHDLYILNPNATFNLYVVDFYLGLVQSILYANKIPQTQYKITVLSDGSFSYNVFNQVYSGSNPNQTHTNLIASWNSAKNNAYSTGRVSSGFTLSECNNHVYAAVCAEPSASWWLARVSDTIFSGDGNSFANTAKTNPQVVVFSVSARLAALSNDDRALFKLLYKFNDTYFSEAVHSNKQIMMFLGTTVNTESNFKDYALFTMGFYGDDYVYYYKGHPGTPTGSHPSKQAELDALDIVDIESSIPAELILFFFPELYLSGYQSSTYASVPVGMGKFMFNMNKASGLGNPQYSNMDAWISQVTSSSPAAIRDLCNINNRCYLVEFSDSFISKINNAYSIAIWDASVMRVSYYRLSGSSYIFVKSDIISEKSIKDGIYTISAKCAPGMVIDISGGSWSDGANVQIWNNNSTDAQTFRFKSAGDGYFTIQNAASGKMIDVAGAGQNAGTNVWQYYANGTAAQKWKPVSTGDNDGSIYLISACNGMYLDVQWAGKSPGTNVCVYTGNRTDAQKFFLNKITQVLPNGFYNIVSVMTNSGNRIVLDIAGGSYANGANAQIYESNGTGAQQFELRYNPNTGYYTIRNRQSGLYLDVAGAGQADKTNVWQYSGNGTRAQQWRIVINGDGSYTVVSATGSGCVLDVAGANTNNWTNVWIYSPNNTNAQKWWFVNIP